MPDDQRKPRASGHVYVFDAATGTHLLMFGRCGVDPTRIRYQVTSLDRTGAAEHFDLLASADMSELRKGGVLRDLGTKPLTVSGQVDGEPYEILFQPDRSTKENAVFETTSGLRGAVIETQSSDWGLVAVVAILAVVAVAAAGLSAGTEVKIEASVDTLAGGANVNVEVGGRPPGGGEEEE